jgi:hypothetical protein
MKAVFSFPCRIFGIGSEGSDQNIGILELLRSLQQFFYAMYIFRRSATILRRPGRMANKAYLASVGVQQVLPKAPASF